jgi:hypothetical protein
MKNLKAGFEAIELLIVSIIILLVIASGTYSYLRTKPDIYKKECTCEKHITRGGTVYYIIYPND